MRVVFDTHVVVAGLVARGLCHELIEVHLPLHEAVLSPGLWDELLTTLEEKFGLGEEDLPFLALYRKHASWVEPPRLEAPISRDHDDRVLATAVAGKADLIVTGDEDLLILETFKGVEILTPRRFLEAHASSAPFD